MTTLIIGGGLSGLAVARGLHAAGQDFILLEARSRFGGRIKTERIGGAYFDMGPAWFWPYQPRIANLMAELGLRRFDQFSDGALIFENGQGQVQRGQGHSSMEGSFRIAGGMGALIDAMVGQLPAEKLHVGAPVVSLRRDENRIIATTSQGSEFTGDRVVVALPPRIAAQLSYSPKLPENVLPALISIPTWMAGQAKAVVVYDTPFWRNEGLSGDAMSRRGPLVEIHDASTADGEEHALFGFIGVPPQHRSDVAQLRDQIVMQMTRLFGEKAAFPNEVLIKDWAVDTFTATEADKEPMYAHPKYGQAPELKSLWEGAIEFANTENAAQFGGVVEGALEAAQSVLAKGGFGVL